MKRKSPEDPPYALYHVNKKTGKKVRYPKEVFPAVPRQVAEEQARDSRFGCAISNTVDPDWQTEAHPDDFCTSWNRGALGTMKPVADVARICGLCGVDRTPLVGGLNLVNDRRGDCLGLFGDCCYRAVLQAVNESPRAYRSYGMITTAEIHKILLARAREIAGLKPE